MSGVNKVIVIGNLGNDPEIRYMPSGGAVASISVATSEQWRDKQTGEMKEQTEWHRITLFNRLGEIAGEYLKKGSKVYIEGSLRTEKYQAKDGTDRWSTKIIARNMQMLDSRAGGGTADFNQGGGGGGGGYSGGQGGGAPQGGGQNRQGPPPPPPQQQQQQGGGNAPPAQGSGSPPAAQGGGAPADDFDDDIPF